MINAICVGKRIRMQVAGEKGCTEQTVKNAMMYSNNNVLHQEIRQRLKELLLAEAKSIEVDLVLVKK